MMRKQCSISLAGAEDSHDGIYYSEEVSEEENKDVDALRERLRSNAMLI